VTAERQGGLFETPAPPNGHKIVIIDGHALAYRAYFAIRDLSTSKGQPVGAIYGFIRSLLRILKEEGEFDATVVVFDAPAKTFRHEQYEAYKAGRAPMPEDLPWQIEIIKRLVTLLGLHSLEVPGLEADDLIGTIAKRCEALGYTVEIVTSDRDAYQLVSDRICVRGLDKAERLGPAEVAAKYGVTVSQWTDFRALTGDSSDNIPGAKGIGPVTAAKLLQRYGSLDNILAQLDTLEPKGAAQKIRESLNDVTFSRELSRIVTDAEIDIDPERWAKRSPNEAELMALLHELEFGSILKELGLGGKNTTYRPVAWEARPRSGALGYRLKGDNPWQDLLGLAVAADGQVAVTDDPEAMRQALAAAGTLNACDAKALAVYARRHDIAATPGDDPLLMAYVLEPTNSQPEAVARRYGAGEWGADAASRASVTAELLALLPEKLTGKLKELYLQVEKPLAAVLVEMEMAGIRIDGDYFSKLSEELAAKLAQLEAQVRDVAGDPHLNVNSRDQLADLLFGKLKLQAGKKTATGKQSTAVSALEPLVDQHPIVQVILDYRELSKLKSTYLDPLPRLVNPATGRLHTTFNQTVVATGRLSSTNPNLQNIPVRSELGRQIRKGFIAEPGHLLLVADYSQIELRVLAHIADEPALIDAFQRGEDIHRRTAAQVYGVPPEAVTPEMRRVAKVINFGVLYGMSAHRLQRELGIPFEEAERFIANYFAGYPRVRAYIEKTLAFARQEGYVETLLGRRRMIPDINSANRNAREYAERTAYNMPIQGSAADIIKLAMLALSPKLKPFGAKLLLQVHDELILEAKEAVAQEVAAVVREVMEGAYPLKVPLLAEVGLGPNWLEAK
jgi:DNA polymerase-1